MAAVTVRNIPADVHAALKRRAAGNGRSTEAEIRGILADAVAAETVGVGSRIAALADGVGDDLVIPTRDEDFRAVDLS